jgi:hypothetical protein
LFALLPFDSVDHWKPTAFDEPGPTNQRTFCNDLQCFFNWEFETGAAHWVLPPELMTHSQRVLRIMVLCCDEGSTGFSLFWFLGTMPGVRLRVIFHRDAPHRMSNLFTNSLRGVPAVLRSTMDTLLIHKFRRAPYGGGRFWMGCKQMLSVLAMSDGIHPLCAMFAEAIARDRIFYGIVEGW